VPQFEFRRLTPFLNSRNAFRTGRIARSARQATCGGSLDDGRLRYEGEENESGLFPAVREQRDRPVRFRRRRQPRRSSMNWDRIEGNWKQFKGKVKEQWGKLTDDEIDEINGNREQLEGKLQKRYGYAKDEAKRDVDEWFKRM
jgi:uncharacterized protein YjbJ (UPF0337 family)